MPSNLYRLYSEIMSEVVELIIDELDIDKLEESLNELGARKGKEVDTGKA